MRLVLENVSCLYDGTVSALEDISFSVEDGETLCIAGANGSGKSTLLQIIASCRKASGGKISAEGGAGIVFQEPDNQLFMPTVWEDVAFGILKKGMAPAEAKDAAIAALAELDAAELAERPPYKLSGGEKQRAALASVLVMKPEILLLDEPTSSLDPRARKTIITLIKKLPCTKIIATHDLDMILDIADRVLFLRRGRIAACSAAPGLLLDETFLRGIGLELPLSLSRAVPDPGKNYDPPVFTPGVLRIVRRE